MQSLFTKTYFISLLVLFLSSKLLGAQESLADGIKVKVQPDKLTAVFNQIQKQTDYTFAYKNADIKSIEKFKTSNTEQELNAVLKQISQQYSLDFNVIAKVIYVKKMNKKSIGFVPQPVLGAVEKSVSGVVTSSTNEPLIGANIVVKGTDIGTVTDIDGRFSITIPQDATILVVSYIGYQTQEVVIDNQTSYTIILNEDAQALDEIVVIGYGSGTKEKFNGAISKLNAEKLNSYSSANFEQALSGKVAGVQILSNGKNPGENSVIQIRGVNTLTAGTNPLIVVNGIPLTEGTSYSSINSQDIESISILKDAASAAIYGSRASNGVILITTKKGKEGNLKVSYDGYVGVQQRIDKFELTDAYETALFDYDARNYGYISGGKGRSIDDDNATRDANGGGKRSRIPTYLKDYLDKKTGLTNTNWANEVFRSALQQNHYLNLNGGNQKTDYSISFGYLDQENIVIDSDYKRYSNNIKLNSQINDRVKFGINSNISYVKSNPTGERAWSDTNNKKGGQADPAFSIVLMQPYFPVYNEDGSFALATQLDANNKKWDSPISENTIAQAVMSDFTRNNFRMFGNTYLTVDILKDLTFKTSLGGDFYMSEEQYFGPSTFGNYRTPIAKNLTQAAKRDFRRENLLSENTLKYSLTSNEHNFDALLGHSYQQEFRNLVDITSKDFVDDNIRNISGATTNTTASISSKWALESYFSRLQYSFDNRYSLSASLRRDGSSRFGKNTRYGDFTSLSAGWTLSNEVFFPKNTAVSFAKVRTSWGQTGNNQIGNFAAQALISDANYIDANGNLTAGAYISSSPNADLSWEKNTATNFGVDLGLFNNQLFFTAEYYKSKTSGLLLNVPVPQQSGFSKSLQNIGELENSGFELEVSGKGYKVGSIGLSFNANISTNKNKVLALGNNQKQIIYKSGVDFITKIGHPIAQFYNYDVIGVYKSQTDIENDPIKPLKGTEVGDYIVRDANGDGKITPDDRVMQGDYNPEFTYGFGFTLDYKGFDIGAQFFGIEGRKVSDNVVNRTESGEGFFVPSKYYFDNYYNDRNPNGFFRRPDFSSFSSAGRLTRKSNLAILDGDYFRLRSLQIGYTLPTPATESMGIDSVRLYFTGNNLFNLTKFRGYNSDGLDTRSNVSQTLSRGYINSSTPLQRFIAFGLNVNF